MKVIKPPLKAEEMVQIPSVCLTFPLAIYRATTATSVMKCVILFAHYSPGPRHNTFTVTEGARSVPTSTSGACCKHTEERKERMVSMSHVDE